MHYRTHVRKHIYPTRIDVNTLQLLIKTKLRKNWVLPPPSGTTSPPLIALARVAVLAMGKGLEKKARWAL
jgi:hypothetical protein